jgi:hypothetical protein
MYRSYGIFEYKVLVSTSTKRYKNKRVYTIIHDTFTNIFVQTYMCTHLVSLEQVFNQ